MEGQEPGADLEALIRRLRLHQPPPSPYAGHPPTAATTAADELFQPRRAAVLVCLFRGTAGELRVILTKRSSSLSTHSGEVALPGGKADKGDADNAATALREAEEEIGLDPCLVTVVASLEHFLSKVHYLLVFFSIRVDNLITWRNCVARHNPSVKEHETFTLVCQLLQL
ncbi:hypothetical protein BRADI_3g35160v3 [Brachypodium distachyon]|uniref:Nudix hydrolase domain-containing protein n=1 Tax=Brachypodium distachyon TaxID=15368 RepID=A0A0Q3FG93_BRADI|nr:hypothetical protein BRADI_3g35160v3 [Brachypodium distachyon]